MANYLFQNRLESLLFQRMTYIIHLDYTDFLLFLFYQKTHLMHVSVLEDYEILNYRNFQELLDKILHLLLLRNDHVC